MSGLLPVLTAIKSTLIDQLKTRDPSKNLLTEFLSDMVTFSAVRLQDVMYSGVVAIVLTLLRMALSRYIYKPFVKRVEMDEDGAQKFPESAFKVLCYSVSWVYCFYLVVIKYKFFEHPGDVWIGWKLGASVPDDVYIVYVFQLGLYFHALYATCFMDDVRRDYYMMIIHHLLTIALIGFSLNVRYHNIGLLVIFLHDLNDVLLDGSKCLLYMKKRRGKEYPQWDHAATVGFAIFVIVWFAMRLYWYYYKVLYSSGHLSMKVIPEGRFYIFFNIMLWMLFLINAYWFGFILKTAYRVLSGKDLKDVREHEQEGQKQSPKKD